MDKEELNLEDQRKLMKECLDKAITGQVGVFLAETVFDENDNVKGTREMDSRISEFCHPIIRFTREYVFCDLEFTGGAADRKSVAYLFNKYLDKNNEAILNGSDTEYFYNVSVVGTQDCDTYVIDMLNPCFMSVEDDIIHFSFPLDNVSFNKLTANMKRIDEMIEYEERMEADYWEGYREEEQTEKKEPVEPLFTEQVSIGSEHEQLSDIER